LIPSKSGFVEFSVKLLESRIISRSAMKPASVKSALDGDITAGRSMEASSEMLNEMQRENGGDLVQEDHSRYRVSIMAPGATSAWAGDVEGHPALYPLDSVNVLTADKLMIVLNQANQKLWQSTLSYNVVPGLAALDEASATYGLGPCAERKGTLYVFDQGVLSAFDLKTGDARWRLPSVGITGLFFDDQDMVYVNTTTASHASLKYSKQIDLSQKVGTVILKLDSRDGKILWSAPAKGLINYVSGKYILAAQTSMPDNLEDADTDTGLEKRPWMRIRRISPASGREIWDHFQERAPLDIAFDQNTIRLVFKKEVQVLRFPKW
jgi:outer membrane protein assembly factor BamB